VITSKMLLAIDQFETGQAAADFSIGLAAATGSQVEVLHIRELPNSLRVPPLETIDEAQMLVEETVRRMQRSGIRAEGQMCSDREHHVAQRIVDEASKRGCDAIVLGSLRLRGFESVFGHGTRERVLKLSSLPVIVTPTAQAAEAGSLVRH
jgi:nucleotide-binding universal stress UspA family protein